MLLFLCNENLKKIELFIGYCIILIIEKAREKLFVYNLLKVTMKYIHENKSDFITTQLLNNMMLKIMKKETKCNIVPLCCPETRKQTENAK